MDILYIVWIRHGVYGVKNSSSAHEIAMILIGMDIMIFGSILKPLVSSSKNLNNPALDAGNGAFFFLSAISDSEI